MKPRRQNVVRPLFLLGPGRSGTTLLYKLLALHPHTAFISNYDVHSFARPFAGTALRLARSNASVLCWAWFAASGQAYWGTRPILRRFVPMPVEGEQVYAASGLSTTEYLGAVPKRVRSELRERLAGVQGRGRARAIVLKRTANNRRIPALDSIFPEARYVVLWRDGRSVVPSLMNVHWWLDHRVWWAGGRTPRELAADRNTMISIAARNWVEEVDAIERGLQQIDPERILTIRYENLLCAPHETLSGLLKFAGLDALPEYFDTVSAIKLRPVNSQWRARFSAPEISLIERIEASWLRRLSYM